MKFPEIWRGPRIMESLRKNILLPSPPQYPSSEAFRHLPNIQIRFCRSFTAKFIPDHGNYSIARLWKNYNMENIQQITMSILINDELKKNYPNRYGLQILSFTLQERQLIYSTILSGANIGNSTNLGQTYFGGRHDLYSFEVGWCSNLKNWHLLGKF